MNLAGSRSVKHFGSVLHLELLDHFGEGVVPCESEHLIGAEWKLGPTGIGELANADLHQGFGRSQDRIVELG